MAYRYVFGPVHSWRMGYSLGIDPIPRKTCSMDCVYCEVGRTDRLTMDRREWLPLEEIVEEVSRKLTEGHRIDVITISGSGEPLLHSRLGEMVDRIHEMSDLPVCILTNGTHLVNPAVRAEAAGAEIVAPSLDAVTPELFRRINNPHPDLKVGEIIEGLKALRREFDGQIWLEILFVSGFNDHDAEVRRLAAAVKEIRPDRVHLSTVIRPPACSGIEGIGRERLAAIGEDFGPIAQPCFAPAVEKGPSTDVELHAVVEETAARRPITRQDLADVLGRPREEIDAVVERLLRLKRITERTHNGAVYLSAAGRRNSSS